MAIEFWGSPVPGQERLLTDALGEFLTVLHRRFEPRRQQLLADRQEAQRRFDRSVWPDFLPETEEIRRGEWTVDPAPSDLNDRRVEITGPTDAKMVINALNSGARVFMADFEDALTPTWANLIQGQLNLAEAIDGTLTHIAKQGKTYQLNPDRAVLVVRPRGWHLDELHVRVDGEPMSGSLFDFGVYLFHNHARLKAHRTGPYFYLPKIEHYREAEVWNDVFDFAEGWLNLTPGWIKATVLIETITAALQMEEILYVLRRHAVGLNAGRWDYLFSIIKKFREHSRALLPDRGQVTMTVPFMRAYAELLVHTCHRRGAHAIGGMAAFVPSRRDADVNQVAFDRVTDDKQREAGQGFDGTWVAHPDLVPVAAAVFDAYLGSTPHQKQAALQPPGVRAADLLNFAVPGGSTTPAGVQNNLAVAVRYLSAWLSGQGAVALNHLMEDAATAEIARAQLYQWRAHRVQLSDGREVTTSLLNNWLGDLAASLPPTPTLDAAIRLVRASYMEEPMGEFITEPAYRTLVAQEIEVMEEKR